MKASELRIGSIIKQGRVDYIEANDAVLIFLRCNGRPTTNPEPEPLTEEWINREPTEVKEWKGNGYDYRPETSKTVEHWYRLDKGYSLVFSTWSYRKDTDSPWFEDKSISLFDGNHYHHLYRNEVHVLQNLYHSLTGTELTIKE